MHTWDAHREASEFGTAAHDPFRLALEAAPTGMIVVDNKGLIVLVNAQIERLFQYSREELIGKPIELLVPLRFRTQHPNFRNGFYADSTARPMGAGRDLYGLRKDQTEIPVEIGLNPLTTPEGRYVLSSVVDITERKRMDEALRSQLRERDVLLQEVHHRVKNNLQVISSLINLQLASMTSDDAISALQECSARVQSIALIHEQLYVSKNFARVSFSEYAQQLASAVFRTAGVNPSAVRLELDMGAVVVGVDAAIPCGLILNELIINALKHGFPDDRHGKVYVKLQEGDDGMLLMMVRDDGVGLPPGFDPKKSSTLGMHLIFTLAEQIGARFTIENDQGTVCTLQFADAKRE